MKPMKEERAAIRRWNAVECAKGDFVPCEGLGYEGKAAVIPKEKEVTFELPDCPSDSVEVEVRLLPSHPVEGTQLRFTIALDKEETLPIHYETKGRSEEWKENVLRNQAIRRVALPARKKKLKSGRFYILFHFLDSFQGPDFTVRYIVQSSNNPFYSYLTNKTRFAYFDLKILKRKHAEKDYSEKELMEVEKLGSRITGEEELELIDTVIVKTTRFCEWKYTGRGD